MKENNKNFPVQSKLNEKGQNFIFYSQLNILNIVSDKNLQIIFKIENGSSLE